MFNGGTVIMMNGETEKALRNIQRIYANSLEGIEVSPDVAISRAVRGLAYRLSALSSRGKLRSDATARLEFEALMGQTV